MPSAMRMTQPPEMRMKAYVYGVEKGTGDEAWALFEACALGDVASEEQPETCRVPAAENVSRAERPLSLRERGRSHARFA